MTDFTGAGIQKWVLAIVGNIFIIILVVRSVSYYAKAAWGELATNLAAAVVLVGMVYFPNDVISILKTVWQLGGK